MIKKRKRRGGKKIREKNVEENERVWGSERESEWGGGGEEKKIKLINFR